MPRVGFGEGRSPFLKLILPLFGRIAKLQSKLKQ